MFDCYVWDINTAPRKNYALNFCPEVGVIIGPHHARWLYCFIGILTLSRWAEKPNIHT